MFLVVRTLRKTVQEPLRKLGDITEQLERLESSLPVLASGVSDISGI